MSIIKKFVRSILSVYPFSALGEIVSACRYIPELRRAIIDPNGFGMLALRISYLGIPRQYHHVFYELKEGDVCIDGGANLGIFTDLVISRGGICHSFEPNPVLFQNLQRKYRNNEQVILHQEAISDKNDEATFRLMKTNEIDYIELSEGGAIVKRNLNPSQKKLKDVSYINYQANAIKFTDFLSCIPHIYILKLDIEGAEFSVLEDIVTAELYKNVDYIFCETHERSFADGENRLTHLKNLIDAKQITNIYLDWV